MDDMPDALEVLNEISETERTDATSRFLAAEATIAVDALMSGRQAVVDSEALSGWMYVRLLSETAIRIRWIAGPSDLLPARRFRHTLALSGNGSAMSCGAAEVGYEIAARIPR